MAQKKPTPKPAPKSDIPPAFDYAAERKKRAGEKIPYMPGTMKSKPPKPKKGGITGMKTRRQMFKDAFGDM